MQLRPYQIEISQQGVDILRNNNLVYLAMQVRTGKTITALEIARLYCAKSVLFVTKLKAFGSIKTDYENYSHNFNCHIINKESIHKLEGSYDLVILDESHGYGTFPKPSLATKRMKQVCKGLPIIYLSGTPTPESYSQLYHQFWISSYSPFKEYKNFYKWVNDFVKVTQTYTSYGKCNNYSEAKIDLIKPIIDPITLTYTQEEAGFTSSIIEHVLRVKMEEKTYKIADTLMTNRVVQGKEESILGDTSVKLQQKLHQIYSGTVKFESGNSRILDTSKATYIRDYFKGKKIGIYYIFKEELNMLKEVLGDNLTEDIEEFNTTDKNIALQVISGREGISLKNADYLVFINIGFSALSYWQARDRMTTIDRPTNEIFWIFSEGGIEDKIYKSVMNKKDFTNSVFKKEYKYIC